MKQKNAKAEKKTERDLPKKAIVKLNEITAREQISTRGFALEKQNFFTALSIGMGLEDGQWAIDLKRGKLIKKG